MNLQALNDRVVIRRDPKPVMSTGGIIIEGTEPVPDQGTVMAVGPGKRNERTGDIVPMSVAVGDVVMYGKYSGQSVKSDDGSDLIVMSETDILAVID